MPNVPHVLRYIHPGHGAAVLACALLIFSAHAALSEQCKPRHPLPTINLKNMGVCDFNLDSLSYRGTPEEQAKCLMRGEDQSRNLGPPMDNLPDALASRVGRDTGSAVARNAQHLPVEAGFGMDVSRQSLAASISRRG